MLNVSTTNTAAVCAVVKVPVQQRLRWLSYVGGRGEYVTWVLRRPVASLTKHLCYRTGLLLCCRMSLVRQSGVITFIMKCNYAIIDVSFYKLGKIRKHRENLMCLWERERERHTLFEPILIICWLTCWLTCWLNIDPRDYQWSVTTYHTGDHRFFDMFVNE